MQRRVYLIALTFVRLAILLCQAKIEVTEDGQPRLPPVKKCGCTAECYSISVAWATGSLENVAYGKSATGSSSDQYNPPCAAVDGSYQFKSPTCFRSRADDRYPWLQIDIEHVITFEHFVIYRGHDDNDNGAAGKLSLAGLSITVDGIICYVFGKTPADYENLSRMISKKCSSIMTGRYMRLYRTEKIENRPLIICEVHIWVCQVGYYGNIMVSCQKCPDECEYACNNYFGCQRVLHNVAIRKPATLSQTDLGEPNALVAGVLFNLQRFKCSQFLSSYHPAKNWFRVDLLGLYMVYSMAVTSRDDCCIGYLLYETHVLLLDSSTIPENYTDHQICKRFDKETINLRQRKEYSCTRPVLGKYGALVVVARSSVGMCQFELYGHRVTELPAGSVCSRSEVVRCRREFVCGPDLRCVPGIGSNCQTNSACVPGAVCDLNKCRYDIGHECDPTLPMQCRHEASCDTSTRKCKIKVGNICQRSDDCLGNAVCDAQKRCAKRLIESCAMTSECMAGASCERGQCNCKLVVSEARDGICVPNPGRVLSHCTKDDACQSGVCRNNTCACQQSETIFAEDFSCKLTAGEACGGSHGCGTGLECINGQCKLTAGQGCYANSQHCIEGTTCLSDVCRLKPGQACTGKEVLCTQGTACIDAACKIDLGEVCLDFTQQCQSGYCSTADKNTCRINTGQPCGQDTGHLCKKGSFCENGAVCKLKIGQPCTDYTACPAYAVCSFYRPPSQMKCRLDMGQSGCEQDEDCVQNTVCDLRRQCRIAKGGSCKLNPSMCLYGAECVDGTCQCNQTVSDAQSAKCDAKAKQVGGNCVTPKEGDPTAPCDDPVAVCSMEGRCECAQGYIPNPATLICGLRPGSVCSTSSDSYQCLEGSVCDGNLCVLTVGQSCRGDARGHCAMGSLCDVDNTCRLDVGQNCVNAKDSCREGAACDVLTRCKWMPGKPCIEDSACMAGSNCSLGKCQCIAGIAALSAGICVPNEGIVEGKCRQDITCADPLASCNTETSKCQCKVGYTGNPNTLLCAKALEQQCSTDRECTKGLICDPSLSKCRLQVGQLCDGKNKDLCVTEAVCDFDSVCKLDLNGTCSGANKVLCRSGTFCDWLGQCKHGVGDSCSSTSEQGSCIAGANCVESVCACDNMVSSEEGALCEPLAGRYGGSCEATCHVPNSRCEQGICQCLPSYQPDRFFNCMSSKTIGSRGLLVMAAVAGAAFLGLLLTVIILFVFRRRRNEKAKKAMMDIGEERMKAITALQEGVGLLTESPSQGGQVSMPAVSEATSLSSVSEMMSTQDPVSETSEMTSTQNQLTDISEMTSEQDNVTVHP